MAGVGLGYEDAKVIEAYDLLDGLANDSAIYPDFQAGWKVSQIVDAVLLSAERRQWVTVSEV